MMCDIIAKINSDLDETIKDEQENIDDRYKTFTKRF